MNKRCKPKKIFVKVNGCNWNTYGFKIKIELSYCSAFLSSLSSIEIFLLMLRHNQERHYGIINEFKYWNVFD